MWCGPAPTGATASISGLEDWRSRPAAGPRLGPVLSVGEEEGAAVPSALQWSADEGLKVIALSGEFARLLGIEPASAAGMPLTRLLQLEENDEGDMPLIGALAARRGFAGQRARLRTDESTAVLLRGEIVTAADGSFAGFRGHAAVEGDVGGAKPSSDDPASFDRPSTSFSATRSTGSSRPRAISSIEPTGRCAGTMPAMAMTSLPPRATSPRSSAECEARATKARGTTARTRP